MLHTHAKREANPGALLEHTGGLIIEGYKLASMEDLEDLENAAVNKDVIGRKWVYRQSIK